MLLHLDIGCSFSRQNHHNSGSGVNMTDSATSNRLQTSSHGSVRNTPAFLNWHYSRRSQLSLVTMNLWTLRWSWDMPLLSTVRPKPHGISFIRMADPCARQPHRRRPTGELAWVAPETWERSSDKVHHLLAE